ncbi:triose-phosphate isomerase [Patescibacteria group bacterium]|nr:triose-phosphate isomerase [Patescibacteria group bacterium]MBU1500424.1 triose-phosphate isomerase [Patescibacteria group bacterium]MBU2080492.1 triose-phosphate isomerase [Patescibacteria group bacterium]MBU2123703.1 triose-phosphate isomerase [Patescibacteria group bacterium]MBU2194559.1 triose-phosphate isomerase [Patescibacteria group bacterium]
MLIIGNWKAYIESTTKAKALFASAKRLSAKGVHEVVVAPAYPYIGMGAGIKGLILGAQDVSETTGGAQTGEVAAGQLADLGVSYVIAGHSERRARGETDEVVTEKVRHIFAHGMVPVLCVGERERDSDAQYLKEVRQQISVVMEALSQKERLQVVLAYEPVWAIGKTGADAITAGDLAEMVLYIRKILGDYIPGRATTKVKILYGGSVDAENIRMLASGTGVEGFLVGRASADVAAFSGLVKALS